MKLQQIASFLLLINAFNIYFVNSTSASVNKKAVVDTKTNQNIVDNKPNKKKEIESTTINATLNSSNNTMKTTINQTIINTNNTMNSTISMTTYNIMNTTIEKLTTEKIPTTTTKTTLKTTSSNNNNNTFTYDSEMPEEEVPMDNTTKLLIIGGIVAAIIVFILFIWLCSNFGLFIWINRQFNKLTKKRVKPVQFEDIDCDPTNVHFRPRNFKGKGPLIIKKQLKAPNTSVDDERLPIDLKDTNIVFIRKMCAVYEVGSEIENIVDEFERPVKDSSRTKWLRTYEAKIKRGNYEDDLKDAATTSDSEVGTDVEQTGTSIEEDKERKKEE